MLHRRGLLLLLQHLARGGDRTQIWMPDMDVKRLDTSFAMDLDEWEAFPTRVRSPISAAVRKDIFRLNVNVSCMLSQGRLSRSFVLG